MAVKFLDNLDLNDNQLLNARLENLASDPGSANAGDIIYNSTSNLFKYYNGSAWVDPSAGSMTSWNLAADSGSNAAIEDNNTVTITAGGAQGITTSISGNSVTIANNRPFNNLTLASTTGSNSTISNLGTITLAAGTGITTTNNGSGQVTIAATGSGSMSSFTLAGDSGSSQTVSDGDTVDIAGGTLISTVAGATDTVTINHDSVTRSDGGTSTTLAFGDSFTATDGVTSTAQGHITSITTKTYTLPDASANTTYTLDARAVAADSVALDLDASTGTDSSVSLQKASDNNIAIVRSSATLVTFGLQNDISVSGEVDTGTLNVNTTSTFGDTLSMEGSKITNLATPTAGTDAANKTYVDSVVVGNLVFQGGYNAATNTPDLDSSPSSSIKKGWSYVVTAAGSFFTETVEVGDFLIAQQDAPTTLANWVTVQNNIGIATTTTPGIASFAAANFAVSAAGEVTLADTTVTAATYGSASAVPVFAVNAKGQVTSVTNTSISITHAAVSDFDTEVDARIKLRQFDGTNSGSGTSHTFNHDLGTKRVMVQLYDSSTFETVFAKVVRSSTSAITVTTATSLSAGDITALVTVID